MLRVGWAKCRVMPRDAGRLALQRRAEMRVWGPRMRGPANTLVAGLGAGGNRGGLPKMAREAQVVAALWPAAGG